MATVRRAVVLVVALALSGCWLHPGFGPARQNSNPLEERITEANVTSLHEAWSTPTEGGDRQPLVTPRAVYLDENLASGTPQSRLRVHALSRRSGTTLWQRDLSDDQSTIGGGGAILSVAGDEVLTARVLSSTPARSRFQTLDAATGATKAQATTASVLRPETAAVGSGVIANREFSSEDGLTLANLVVRSRATFDVLWTAPLVGVEGLMEPVLIAHGRIYVRDVDERDLDAVKVYPVGGCGAPTCAPTSTFTIPLRGMFSPFVRLLAVTDDGHILLHDSRSEPSVTYDDLITLTRDGELDWTVNDVPGLSGVAAAGDTVAAIGDAWIKPPGVLVVRSGSSTWRADGAFTDAPVMAGGLVYAATSKSIHVYDADGCGSSTCPELMSISFGTDADGVLDMSVAGGTLFVTRPGRLSAFEPTT